MCSESLNSAQPAVVQVVGASGSGKTTLIEGLIPRLRAHGLRVGSVKHAHHGFEMDRPGKDSWRHAQAGAEAVAAVSPTQAAWMLQTPKELGLAEVVEAMRPYADLILVEGFKGAALHPRIQLEPASGARLEMTEARCRVGVTPAELSLDEWRAVVRFCVRAAPKRTPCRAQ